MDGVEATREATLRYPEVKVIAVTTFSSERYLIPALRSGAVGYLVKDTEPKQIMEAIRGVHGGGSILSPTVTRDLIAEVRDTEEVPPHGASDTMPPLIEAITEREQAVLDLLAQGLSNVEMSQQLYVSEATVKSHMRSLMRKLGVRDRVQVLIDATRRGLISL